MDFIINCKNDISIDGFTIINNVYTPEEIEAIVSIINKADQSNLAFRKTDDLFAIRRFLKEVPNAKKLLFNDKLRSVIEKLFGDDYFIVKSIYFDKPEKSNWFVS
jgi:hypothetical protein